MASLRPYALLTLLGLLFFWELVLAPTQVLYSDGSDVLAEHLPARTFLVRSFQQTGELPLWNPHSSAGSPFVHDIQVAIFYPPHLPLTLMPESWLGPALSWLVVLHVLIAGWGTYAYAVRQGLSSPAALVAAIGTMFAGKWMLHVLAAGHTVTLGVAWLPLVLLLLEEAIRRRCLLRGIWAGAVYGLLVLGTQPQWTLYAGIFIGLWTLGTALESAGYLGGKADRSLIAALAWWLGLGALTAAVAVGLAAIQLWPTLEASRHIMRTQGIVTGSPLREGLLLLLGLFGPSLSLPEWEYRGGLSVLWASAAIMAPILAGGKVRYQAAVCLGLVVFSLGGSALVQDLPGLNLFRQHVRMLIVAGFPLSYLAGVTTQKLFVEADPGPELRRRCVRLLIVVVGFALLTVGWWLLSARNAGFEVHLPHYWVGAVLTVPLAVALLLGHLDLSSPRRLGLWALLLLVELWTLAMPLVEVRPAEAIYPQSASVLFLAERRGEHGRVFDRTAPGRLTGSTPLGTGGHQSLLHELEATAGYSPLDVLRYREYLGYIGGRHQPLKALDGSELSYPILGDFPVKNDRLLDLLGVRYVLAPQGGKPPGSEPDNAARWELVSQDAEPNAFLLFLVTEQTNPLIPNRGALPSPWWRPPPRQKPLPPYAVYRNKLALPRAFVVPQADRLPSGERSHVLAALEKTDFKQTVLLEDWTPTAGAPLQGQYREADIADYRPNRVTVKAQGPGFLVLTDVMYPGWTVTVDGQPAELYRANYLFRAVELPAGDHEVVFTFAPQSYRRGRLITAITLALLVVVTAGGLAWRLRRR